LSSPRQRLLTLIVGSGSLTQQVIDLKEMRQTIEIAATNMKTETAAWASATTSPDGLFAEDLAVAHWFGHRLSYAITYLELDRERARDTLTALTVQAEAAIQDRREALQRREAQLQQKQNKVTLLQTAILGALLMMLTAIRAFNYKVRFLTPSAVPALISLLGALALWLAALVLFMLTPGERRWQQQLGGVCGGLVAATTGWLVTTITAKHATGRTAAAPLTWTVVAMAFAAGWMAMFYGIRAYRERTRS
jgi:hypothetical protein